MIKPGEIQQIASSLQLKDTQIEKDYIISWILRGVYSNDYLKNRLVFKGGTLLRKVYYPEYRLSEDLDFTFAGVDFNTQIIKKEFNQVFEWVLDESRIRLTMLDDTELTTGNYNFYISYVGPLGGIGAQKSIKVDISSTELIINEPVYYVVQNEYSDLLEGYTIKCYSLDELIPEKMRSLMQRTEPRDLYDIWCLFEVEELNIEDFIYDFQEKARRKGYDPAALVSAVNSKEHTFARNWDLHLANQITDLPDFKDVWRELGKHWKRFSKFNLT